MYVINSSIFAALATNLKLNPQALVLKKDILYVLVQFVLFALYFIDWNLFSFVFPDWLRLLAIGFLAIGLLIIFFGVLHLNENLTVFPSPKKGASLICNGIYAYIRHPIYAGIIVAMTFYAIYAVSPIKFVITGIMIVVLYLKSNYEERKLIESFSTYEEYKAITGRFFPNFSKARCSKLDGNG